MNDMDIKRKLYRTIGLSAGVVAIIIVGVFTGVYLSATPSPARAQATLPTITFNPGYGNNGSVIGGSFTISGSGPFTEDFQVAICLQEQGRNGNRTDCAVTPWASTLSSAGNSQASYGTTDANYTKWWSTWSAAAENTIDANWALTNTAPATTWDGTSLSGFSNESPSVFIATRPLPAGESINSVQLGFEVLDDNNQGQMQNAATDGLNGDYCNSGGSPYTFTPLGGGTSGNTYGYTYGDCDSGHISGLTAAGLPDYFRVYMSGGVFNAIGAGNNIPASFNVSQTIATGTDSNPLAIVVENTGGGAWASNQTTLVAGSAHGTCTDGTQPDPSDPQGSSCTASYNNYSNVLELKHVSGSFSTGNDPAQFDQVTQQTCTVGGPDCDNQSCSGDQNACTSSGYCSLGSFYQNQGDCTDGGGTWTQGCNSTWEKQISCTNTGDPNVEPGATTTFLLGSLTAPATAGNYTEDWQMMNNGSSFGSVIPVNIRVGASVPTSTPTGIVNVASEDSQTGSAVTSSFDVVDGATDLCDPAGGTEPCKAQNQTFNNSIPLGIPVFVSAVSNSAGSLYAFGGVKEELPIAQKKTNILSNLFALSKNFLIGEADAYTNCAYIGTSGGCAPPITTATPGYGAVSLTPDDSIPADLTDNFVILWDPQASMSVTPSSVSNSLSSAGTVGTVTVSNTSAAPGAELGWSSSVSYTNGNNWLSVTPSTDASGLADGSSDTVTIAYTGGLAPGTYEANVTFNGDSIVGGSSTALPSPPPPVSVTLIVTNASGGPYFSCFSNQCAVTATPGATSCDSACGVITPPSPAPTCTPSSITTAQTSQCVFDLNGVPQNGVTWKVASGSTGSISGSGVYTPSGTGTEAIVGTLPDGSMGQATVTVTAPPLPPCGSGSCQATCSSPTLSASPTSIVVPESSSLTYGCSNVTQCTLTGGGLNSTQTLPSPGPINGNATTTPSITTTYTLTCINGNYSSDSTSNSVRVTVGGSSLCEQNPNGAGCSGQ